VISIRIFALVAGFDGVTFILKLADFSGAFFEFSSGQYVDEKNKGGAWHAGWLDG